MTKPKILYMGTPEFARANLQYLIEQGCDVAAVVCRPDAMSGRGQRLTPPPVKVCALEHGLAVYQPATLKDGAFEATLKEIAPDLIVVVAYGMMLPGYILDSAPLGVINLHGSLLPEYRGAAPIQRSIIDGKKKTGLTTMYLCAGMDEGDMILSEETDIDPNETAGELTVRLAELGGPLLMRTIELIAKGEAPRTPQDHSKATYAPMISKEEARLDFNMSAERVYNIFRGCSPNPGVTARHRGKVLRITAMELCEGPSGVPGEVVEVGKRGAVIACKDGAVRILRLAPEGKKEMAAGDFVNGRGIEKAEILNKEV
ncbi:MAG: methionyl-tRNA formyltransferase [Clostridia bacterium]|nr:methionyl-tRNA formyltransferase [Clostridia bacterium]